MSVSLWKELGDDRGAMSLERFLKPLGKELQDLVRSTSREDIRQAVRDVSREAERRMYVVRIMELEAENARLRKEPKL